MRPESDGAVLSNLDGDAVVTLTPNPALDIWTTTQAFRRGPKLRCSRPDLFPGGGGINVSRVVKRLGGRTVAVHASGGRVGEDLAEALEREELQSGRTRLSGVTREVFNVCEEDTGDVMRFVTPGPVLDEDEADDLLRVLGEHLSGAAIVVGSGSLPEGIGEGFWGQVAKTCRDSGVPFFLDSHDGAEAALSEGVFVFRETNDAVGKLAGQEVSWPEEAADWAAERVRAGEAQAVVVTQGAEGALLVTEDLRLVQSPPQGIEGKSAIGAGDSFMGGFTMALSQAETWEAALRQAVATAAATLLTPGTELCRKEDVERLLKECPQVREL